jgi:uncharacterized peroxidase-related enzyme
VVARIGNTRKKEKFTMTALPIPASIAESPAASQPLLQAVEKQFGLVPNAFRLIGTSPASLEGFLALSGALGKGQLDPATRGRLALAVAESNGCDYCLSAHTYIGKNLIKLSEAEMIANRDGGSTDPKAAAAVHFAIRTRGHVADADLKAVKDAGYSDAQIIEIVMHVALNTLTNYANVVGRAAIDFPVVTSKAA